jgi:thiol-disulfide isomerase/thioredoxin
MSRAEVSRGILWSVPQVVVLTLALTTMPGAPEADVPGAARSEPEPAPTETPADPVDTGPDAGTNVVTPDGAIEARDIAPLLRRPPFELRGSPGRYTDIVSLLRGRSAVTVVNLWASYCEPCKREFPALRRLQETWGREVRYVSIQLGKDDAGALLEEMPIATFDLHDVGAGAGTFREKLAALGLAEKNAPIPITMVLDCKHQLRWLRARELTGDIAQFSAFVEELRKELRTDYCAPPPSAGNGAAAQVAEVPTEPRCGDGKCGDGENEGNCCLDCGCKDKAHICGLREKNDYICRLPKTALMK